MCYLCGCACMYSCKDPTKLNGTVIKLCIEVQTFSGHLSQFTIKTLTLVFSTAEAMLKTNNSVKTPTKVAHRSTFCDTAPC